MKIALIHDHLTQEGGAERVLKVFQEIWPAAPTYTLVYDAGRIGHLFAGHRIVTSFLQRLPGARRHPQWYLPLMPTATESYDLRPYDVVLSSCSAFAKGVITRSNTVHVCYCHTPTRYLWSDTHQYVEDLPYPRFVKRKIRRLLTGLRTWDQLAAQRVDRYVANSRNVAERIAKYYRRESDIVYPPVEIEQFASAKGGRGNYYLTGGRLVPYKRFDLVVAAFNRLNIPLKVFGEGPALPRLRKMAKSNVEFLGKVDGKTLADRYASALAFIQPQVEDFGITAIEAMATGRPVIAYAAGGAVETVLPGQTGAFFDEQSWESLADAVIRFQPEDYQASRIRQHASQFGVFAFRTKICQIVEQAWQTVQEKRWPVHQAADAIREGRAVPSRRASLNPLGQPDAKKNGPAV